MMAMKMSWGGVVDDVKAIGATMGDETAQKESGGSSEARFRSGGGH